MRTKFEGNESRTRQLFPYRKCSTGRAIAHALNALEQPMGDEIRPFKIHVSEADLEDLKKRLRATRWPDPQTVPGWSQGVPLDYVQKICEYWARDYDWRKIEARLNALPQFHTDLDGLGIYFLHIRSPHVDAAPLILTHGWPRSSNS
jgi:hypothetical protein